MTHIYKGISPYDGKGNYKFAGRRDETLALYERIVRNDYTVYYASSGEGKSSLIRAGLIPILKRRGYFPVYITFKDVELNSKDGIDSIIYSKIELELKENTDIEWTRSKDSLSYYSEIVPEHVSILEAYAWWKLRNYCFKRKSDESELVPLFIFDQFEDIFTKSSYNWTDRFFGWLEGVSADSVPIPLVEKFENWNFYADVLTQKNFKALFSFRTEYLGEFDYWCVQKHFLPSLQDNRLCLKPITPKGAKEIIGLNRELIGQYENQIIQGCSEDGADVENEDQPSVYALILSVVCQKLSEIPKKECEGLLSQLNNTQNSTIDKILLRFYKDKIKEAGLDYNRDEKIVAQIEEALIVNGKRSRKDTNEAGLSSISKWIDALSDKDNGLIKVVGERALGKNVVKTIEFAHDRLCQAIDSSMKERHERIEWKLNRQGEWIRFWLISIIVGIVCVLWDYLMPSIKPVMVKVINIFSKDSDIFAKITESISTSFKTLKYLRGFSYGTLDEGISTFLLMAFMFIFAPIIVSFVNRKSIKWYRLSGIVSFISTLCFGSLLWRISKIGMVNDYMKSLTFVGTIISMIVSFFSIYKYRLSSENKKEEKSMSWWPLFSGYFIFFAYLFHECIYRFTFGIPHPIDSSWGIVILPVLFFLILNDFFYIKTYDKTEGPKTFIALIVGLIALSLLLIVILLPFNSYFKQEYGILSSLCLITIYTFAIAWYYWHKQSFNPFSSFSTLKKTVAVLLCGIVASSAFWMNLGYYPLEIKPNSVRYVIPWKTIFVEGNAVVGDSMEKKYGILFANGDTIIPCCIELEHFDRLKEGKYPIKEGKVEIKNKAITSNLNNQDTINSDESLKLTNGSLFGYIPVNPLFEDSYQQRKRPEFHDLSLLDNKIDYYAAILFGELRKANINYLLTGRPYTIDNVKSLYELIKWLKESLTKELEIIERKSDTAVKNVQMQILEEKHVFSFHKALASYYLLCLLKDRIVQKDMPSVFSLYGTYISVFFWDVPEMEMSYSMQSISSLNIEDEGTTFFSQNCFITSDDFNNQRMYAWYKLFLALCHSDIGWMIPNFEKTNSDILNYISDVKKIIGDVVKITQKNSAKLGNKSWEQKTKELGDLLRKFDPKYYEQKATELKFVLERLENVNSQVADSSLMSMINDVLPLLIKILDKHPDGIYNNDFETICELLIITATFRGLNKNKESESLKNYFIKKHEFFYKIDTIREGYSKLYDETAKVSIKLRQIGKSLKR